MIAEADLDAALVAEDEETDPDVLNALVDSLVCDAWALMSLLSALTGWDPRFFEPIQPGA